MSPAALKAATPEATFREWGREPDPEDRVEYWLRLILQRLDALYCAWGGKPLEAAVYDPWRRDAGAAKDGLSEGELAVLEGLCGGPRG